MLIFCLLITYQPALQAAVGLLIGHLFAKTFFDFFAHGHFSWSAQRHDLAGGWGDVVNMVDILDPGLRCYDVRWMFNRVSVHDMVDGGSCPASGGDRFNRSRVVR